MDPVTRDRISRATASFFTSKGANGILRRIDRKSSTVPAYPTQQQLQTDSGPDFLQMWLWHYLLTPDFETPYGRAHMEPDPVVAPMGECPAGFVPDVAEVQPIAVCSEPETAPLSDSMSTVSDSIPESTAGNLDNIETHYELGAANFS